MAKKPKAGGDYSNRNYEVFWGETREKRAALRKRTGIIIKRLTLQEIRAEEHVR